ncbi:MAG: DUF4157 domain-containing protein [Lewinellaceae bacterium]|nr:DUF4157 domain-containing protein [Lewinellaceae bacterium]
MQQHQPQTTQQTTTKPAAHATPRGSAGETVSMKVGDKDDLFKRQTNQVLQRVAGEAVQKKEGDIVQRSTDEIQKKADETIQRKASHRRLVQLGLRPAVQTALKVNKPGDSHELEADATADKVMRMTDVDVQRSVAPEASRKEDSALAAGTIQKQDAKTLQRKESGVPEVNSATQAAIMHPTGGQKMPPAVQGFMEKRFQVDFSQVKIHNDDQAAGLSNRLGAKAFTYKNNIYFNRGAYQPESDSGKHLLAHELTHVVQQGHAVQRKPETAISSAPAKVQRLGISDALDYFADKAYLIPGFRMFAIILGVNPINMQKEARTAANILRAVVEFLPGGNLITRVLDKYAIFEKAGAWVEGQLNTLGISGSSIRAAIDRFLDSLSWRDIFDLGGVWDRAKRIFTDPIGRIITFVKNLFSAILDMIRQAVLLPLAKLAQGTRGYDLLRAVLGKDPITGEVVPQTADNLIGGFMKLIGQQEVWENIKKGKAVQKAWTWFKTVLKGVLAFVTSIPALIINSLKALVLEDFFNLSALYNKLVLPVFKFVASFVSWGFDQVIKLLKILFSVVAPKVLPYISKAQSAFTTILKNPVRFVGNLVRAGKKGFQLFATNILTHLKTALIKWLVGPLGEAGVYIPKSFGLLEIVKLVLSVLGLTWQNIRKKLVKYIPEPVLKGLEKTFDILITLVREGPAAAWEKIKAELSELKQMLIQQVTQFISVEVVKAAIAKLVTSLNPAGAVIQAILAIYKTISFFIEKINQIAAVVASFIDSIAAIAAGNVTKAAQKVETTMANTLTVIIAFLAKLVGIGGVPKKIVSIIKKIRQPIDKGIDKVVGWLVGLLKKAVGKGTKDARTADEKKRDVRAAVSRVEQIANSVKNDRKIVEGQLPVVKRDFNLTKIALVTTADYKINIKAEINPFFSKPLNVTDEPDLRALLIRTGYFGSSPSDIDKIIKGVKSDGNGDAVFQFIRSGKFVSLSGYEKVLRQLKNPSMVHSVYMALDQADKIPTALLSTAKFEVSPPLGGDIDLLVVSTSGEWAIAYQFKGVKGLGNIANRANESADELKNVPPKTKKIVLIEVRDGTYAEFVASANPKLRHQGYLGGVNAFKSANPAIILRVRFSDGTLKTF